MSDKSSSSDERIHIPKWDVALEGLVKEEQRKLERSLILDDFRRLAQQYTIRLDDIMATVFELCMQGLWRYESGSGDNRQITRELLDELTAGGRLKDEDLKGFIGGWRPVE